MLLAAVCTLSVHTMLERKESNGVPQLTIKHFNDLLEKRARNAGCLDLPFTRNTMPACMAMMASAKTMLFIFICKLHSCDVNTGHAGRRPCQRWQVQEAER
eukprot:2264105-Amphidinium_carterae.1